MGSIPVVPTLPALFFCAIRPGAFFCQTADKTAVQSHGRIVIVIVIGGGGGWGGGTTPPHYIHPCWVLGHQLPPPPQGASGQQLIVKRYRPKDSMGAEGARRSMGTKSVQFASSALWCI